MSIVSAPGATFYPSVDWNSTGATLGVRLRRATDGVDVIARSTAGISESPAGSGIYVLTTGMTAPTTAGAFYLVEWDDTVDYVAEDLTVSYSGAAASVPLATDLCALADVKAYLQKTDTTFDSILASLISRASAAIERYCSREFADKGTLTRTFSVDGPLVDLMPYELRTPTVVTLDPNGSPVALTTDQWLALPSSRSSLGTYLQLRTSRYTYLGSARSDSFGVGEISITGAWGAAVTPLDVAHACVQTAGLWFRREVAARGSGSDLEFGEDLRPLSLPGSAIRLLAPYTRTVLA